MNDEPLIWEVHHGRLQPEKRFAVLAAACGAGLVGMLVFRHPLMGVIGFGCVIVNTLELFVPVKFRLDEKGASAKIGLSETAIEWGDIRREIPVKGGIRLSPLAKPSRLDAFRGVLLQFSGNEDAVLAKIRALWQTNECIVDGRTDPGRGNGSDREDGDVHREEGNGDPGRPVS